MRFRHVDSSKTESNRLTRRRFKPLMEVLEDRTVPATIYWNTDADGYWDNPANWSLNRVPEYTDEVIIDRGASNPTITVRTSENRAGSLTNTERLIVAPGATLRASDSSPSVVGGTVIINGGIVTSQPLKFTGDVTWAETGGFSWGTVTFAGITHFVGSADRGAYNVAFVNEGTFLHEGTGNLLTYNFNYSFTNKLGAVYDFQTDGDMLGVQFYNQGTVRKSGGSGSTRIGGQDIYGNQSEFILQGGTVEGLTGKLILRSANSTGGAFHASAGAVIDITDGNNTNFTGTYTGTGEGRVELSSGTIYVNNNNAAVFNFSQGLFHWVGGSIAFGMVVNQGFVQISGDADKGLHSSGGFKNYGHIIQSGLGNIVQGGARIENKPTGIYEIDGDSDLGAHIYNEGLFRKIGGTGISKTSTPDQYGNRGSFNHLGGTVEVLAGTLSLGGGQESSGGTLKSVAGATIELNGGFDTTLDGTYQLIGEGQVIHQDAYLFTGSNLVIDATQGHFVWLGGTIYGNSFITRGDVEVAGPLGKVLLSHWLLEGTARHTGGSLYGSRSTLEVTPTGVYDFQGDFSFEDIINNGQLNVVNRGLIRKSAGTGDAVINNSYTDSNNGTFEVLSGTMSFPRSGTFNGVNFHVAAGTRIHLNDRLYNAGKTYRGLIQGHGQGEVLFQSTITNSGGSETATFNFDEGVAVIGSDTYFGGEFILQGYLTFNASTYVQWRGGFTNQGVMNMVGSSNLYLYTGGCSFDNQGTIQLFNDSGLIANSGYSYAVEFTNSGTIRKVGGTGTSNIASEGSSGPFRLTNTGTIEVLTGTLSLGSPTSALPQLVAGKLTGGTWKAGPGATLKLANASAITTNQATIIFSGAGAAFTNITGLTRNEGTLRLEQGKNFTTTGAFTNTGNLQVGANSLFQANGSLTLTGTSTVQVGIADSLPSGAFGKVSSSGATTLAGTLDIRLTGYGPSSSDQYPVMTYASKTGSLSAITGLDPYFTAAVNSTAIVLNGQGTQPDLDVITIIAPLQGTVSQQMTINYVVMNRSDTPVSGTWKDAVYLSRDRILSPDDKALGLANHTGMVDAQGTYQGSLNATIPSMTDGQYYVIVVADVHTQVADANRSNNTEASASSLVIEISPLGVNQPVSGLLQQNQPVYYHLNVPADRPDLLLQLQASAGTTVELFAAQGRLPTTADFDLASKEFNSSLATTLVSSPGINPWYVMAIARNGTSSSFTLSAVVATPQLNSASPNKIGNNGPVTVQILGQQLRASDVYQLVSPSGGLFFASNITVTGGTQADASFNLQGANPGVYRLQIVRNGQVFELPHTINVEAVNKVQLTPILLTPGSYRPGMILQGSISVRNESNVDVPAPLLFLYSTTGVRLAFTRQEVAAGTSPNLTNEHALVGVAPSSHPGTLRPGEESRIPFWFQNGPTGISLGLDFQVADTTDPINFTLVEQQMRPAGVLDSRWNGVWPAIRSALGTTWGDYVRFMARYAELSKDQPSPLPDDIDNIVPNFPQVSTGFYFEAENVMRFASQEIYREEHRLVSGFVRLDGQTPVAGALVRLINTEGETAAQAVADKSGRYRILSLNPGTYQVVVNGYQLAEPMVIQFNGTRLDGQDISVQQGGIIDGIIRRTTDAARLSGLPVKLLRNHELVATVYTDSDGHYRFSGIDAGTYQLQAGGGALANTITNPIVVQDQEVLRDVNIDVPLASILSGIVTKNSTPLAGVRVLFKTMNGLQQSVSTDATGRYQFSGLSAGTFELFVQDTNTAPYTTSVTLGSSVETTLPTINLVNGSTLTVRLLNENNVALQGTVSLFQNGEVINFTLSSAEGVASFENLAAGDYTLSARSDGRVTTLTNIHVPVAGSVSTNIVLHPAARAHGTVTSSTGQPIAGMLVNVYGSTPDDAQLYQTVITNELGQYQVNVPYGEMTVTFGNLTGILARQFTTDATHTDHQIDVTITGGILTGLVTKSDGLTPVTSGVVVLRQNGIALATANILSDGTYIFRQLQPGSYVLMAESPDGFTSMISATVVDQATTQASNLSTGLGSLQGVISFAGVPVNGANFVLIPQNSRNLGYYTFGTTDASGHYLVTGLPDGEYLLHIEAEGYANCEQLVTVTSQTVHDVVVNTGVTYAGIVTAQGLPLANAVVTVQSPGSRQTWGNAITDGQGNFSIHHLPAGTYNLLIRGELQQTMLIEDVVIHAASQPASIQLLAANTDLSGIVFDEAGRVVVDAVVTFRTSSGDFVDTAGTDAQGKYSMDRLPAGEYLVTVESLGYRSASASIVITTGIPSTLNLSMVTAGTDDSPLWDASVDALDTVISLPVRALMHAYVQEKLAEIGGKPSRIGGDVGALTVARPTLSPSECPALWQRYRDVLVWYQKKEAAYNEWNQAYSDFEKLFRASAAVVTLQTVNLLLKCYSLYQTSFNPSRYPDEYVKLNDAHQLALPILRGIQTIQAVVGSFTRDGKPFWQNMTSFEKLEEIVKDIGGVLAGAIPTVLSSQTYISLLQNKGVQPISTVGNVFSALGIVKDAYTIYQEVSSSITTLKALLTAIDFGLKDYAKARVYYEDAVQKYLNTECIDPKNPDGPRIKGQLRNLGQVMSMDPNNIVSTGVGQYGAIRPGDTISYTVNFENLASASAAAQRVLVTNQLPNNLDWSTFQLTSVGFDSVIISVPGGVKNFETTVTAPHDPLHPVRITVRLNSTTGMVTTTFQSVDPVTGEDTDDPLAGFLPPNDGDGSGSGFISYDIKPVAALTAGTEIKNQASIIFDANAAIVTNQSLNTIDTEAPVSMVNPLPASTTNTSFTVTWGGTDPHHGAGITTYDVFVAIDNGSYTLWQDDVAITSALFTGETGKKYSFYSRARDGLGYEESAHPVADASIEVSVHLKPSIEKVVIASNASQRSKFVQVQVFFNTLVTVDKSAFVLYLNGKRFTIASIFMTVVDNKSVATLQFKSTQLKLNSLPEGKYVLVTLSKSVKSRQTGLTMEADRTDAFYRLFGDTNGDGRVDDVDYQVFRTALNKKSNQTGYLNYLDYDNNGRIDARDLVAFNVRRNKRVTA